MFYRVVFPFLFGYLVAFPLHADTVSVAVAANFAAPMKALVAQFEQRSRHTILAAYGSTGKFYAQIQHGAPFQVLLAADQLTPQKLARATLALADSQFTYATGRLVLWSADANGVDSHGQRLFKNDFRFLAIADPTVAPYGAAAFDVLKNLRQLEHVRPRLVQGENIAQTYQFVQSRNAELGFVALSQVWRDGKLASGSAWIVPQTLHQPLHQDAIILATAKNHKAVSEWMQFLRSDEARTVIASFGYE